MTAFMDDQTFLLRSEPARRLYHDYANDQPFYDYHAHLPPQRIADNHTFADLQDILPMPDCANINAIRKRTTDPQTGRTNMRLNVNG